MHEFRQHTALVFQDCNLLKNKTVLGNVMKGLVTSRKMPKAEARRVALEQLAKVGMAERADAYPTSFPVRGVQREERKSGGFEGSSHDVLSFPGP